MAKSNATKDGEVAVVGTATDGIEVEFEVTRLETDKTDGSEHAYMRAVHETSVSGDVPNQSWSDGTPFGFAELKISQDAGKGKLKAGSRVKATFVVQ